MKKLLLIPLFISVVIAAEIPEGAAQHGLDDYYTSVFVEYWSDLDEDSYIVKECTKSTSKYYEYYLTCLSDTSYNLSIKADGEERQYYKNLFESLRDGINGKPNE